MGSDLAWWIAAAVVATAIVVLIVAVASLAVSLARLRAAGDALQRRGREAERVQTAVEALQRRAQRLTLPRR